MRIAINGTGVAGPTLAYWLRRYGHEPVLFEQAAAQRTGGYVIDFWGLGYELAEQMGIISDLVARAYLMQRLSLVDGSGAELASMDVGLMREQVQGRFISVARADLAAALLHACDSIPVRFGVSIVGLEQRRDCVVATFSDGQREPFDLVVGADGLHSHVRSLVFGPRERFERSLGCHVAAVRLPGYPHRDELTYVSHTVPKRHVARVALRGGETLVLFIWRSELAGEDADVANPIETLRRAFGQMKWEVPEILARLPAVENVYVDSVSQVHLARWTSGRVALLGDAAACASLLAGEGTGLAMIEAYVLAGEIHRAGENLTLALEAYEARLRPFVTSKQRAALRLRGFFAPKTPVGVWARDVLVNAFSTPFVAKHVAARSLRDDLVLPQYEAP